MATVVILPLGMARSAGASGQGRRTSVGSVDSIWFSPLPPFNAAKTGVGFVTAVIFVAAVTVQLSLCLQLRNTHPVAVTHTLYG